MDWGPSAKNLWYLYIILISQILSIPKYRFQDLTCPKHALQKPVIQSSSYRPPDVSWRQDRKCPRLKDLWQRCCPASALVLGWSWAQLHPNNPVLCVTQRPEGISVQRQDTKLVKASMETTDNMVNFEDLFVGFHHPKKTWHEENQNQEDQHGRQSLTAQSTIQITMPLCRTFTRQLARGVTTCGSQHVYIYI